MIAVSDDFKNAMKEPIKELDAYIELVDSGKITSADDLISFKISCDTSMCKTAMRKLEAKYLGDHNLLGKWVKVGFGVKLSDGNFEYLDYGSFLVTEITTSKDTGVTQIVGYDKMISSMKEYTSLVTEYPIDLYTYTKNLCNACELELGNIELPIHNNWQIDGELWININGITYRDILVQIAQATASTCIIGNDDKVYFKSINNTNETLTYDNLKILKLEPIYGEINSVVLGRDPIVGEDIFLKDDASIETNGLTEFRIVNNEIVDKKREEAIEALYNALHGISYYPFDLTTEGLGWYEIADNFDINTDTETYNTTLFNFSITIDGGIKESLKSVANTKTETQYQYANPISKRIKNTEIIVDKQNQTINSMVSDVNQALTDSENATITANNASTTANNAYQDILAKLEDYVQNNDFIALTEAVQVLQTKNDYTITVLEEILVNGVSKLINEIGYTFDINGLNINRKEASTGTTINEVGITLLDKTGSSENILLFAGVKNGESVVETKNLKVEKYLNIGKKSRFEDYLTGTGCFSIGGGE